MVYHFWYVLIHIGLGLAGYQYFTWTNEGGLLAAAAAGLVQGYAVWEIRKQARPRFEASLVGAATLGDKEQMRQDYKKRLARVWFFRTCIYALLTMIVALIITA
jgi:hypothetical protein